MKKIFLLLFLLSAGFAHADNYFTLGENDYFRINPAYVSGEVTAMVRAHLDGRIDSWSLTMTYPNDLSPYRVTEQEDMTSIPYLNSNGTPCTHSATITTSNGFTVLSSTITEFGYWDFNNDGIYEPYGTIKWEAGDHDKMFKINFDVNGLCAGDSITITGTLSSTYDWRGGTTGGNFYKRIYIRFGYKKGDVNGDEFVNITDATNLTNYILNDGDYYDEYQLDAADVNGDGEINVSDVNLLINIIYNTNGFAGMENIDDPIASILGNSGSLPF